MRVLIYRQSFSECYSEINVDIPSEFLQIDCLDCGGDGIYKGHPEIDELPCNECKTSGKVWVNML